MGSALVLGGRISCKRVLQENVAPSLRVLSGQRSKPLVLQVLRTAKVAEFDWMWPSKSERHRKSEEIAAGMGAESFSSCLR